LSGAAGLKAGKRTPHYALGRGWVSLGGRAKGATRVVDALMLEAGQARSRPCGWTKKEPLQLPRARLAADATRSLARRESGGRRACLGKGGAFGVKRGRAADATGAC